MTKFLTKQTKRSWRLIMVMAAVLAVIIFIYLNRAYSHIYSELGQADLKPSDNVGHYVIGSSVASSTRSLLYVALGDSLTAGVGTEKYEYSYPYQVAQSLAGDTRRVALEDFGIPGERTKGLLADVVPLAINEQPDVITILIGVNDIHGNISAAVFRSNYDSILSRLTKETKAKIYIINIPFLGASSLMLPPYQAYFDYQTKEFNSIISELAAKYKLDYIDLYTPTVGLFKKPGSQYSADLFHPSASGYKIWAKIIYDSINH